MFSSKELEKLHLQLKRLVDPKKIENWQAELTRLEEDNATALKLHNENINGPLMEIVFGPAGGTETLETSGRKTSSDSSSSNFDQKRRKKNSKEIK